MLLALGVVAGGAAFDGDLANETGFDEVAEIVVGGGARGARRDDAPREGERRFPPLSEIRCFNCQQLGHKSSCIGFSPGIGFGSKLLAPRLIVAFHNRIRHFVSSTEAVLPLRIND